MFIIDVECLSQSLSSASTLTFGSFITIPALFISFEPIWIPTFRKIFPVLAVSIADFHVASDLLSQRWTCSFLLFLYVFFCLFDGIFFGFLLFFFQLLFGFFSNFLFLLFLLLLFLFFLLLFLLFFLFYFFFICLKLCLSLCFCLCFLLIFFILQSLFFILNITFACIICLTSLLGL